MNFTSIIFLFYFFPIFFLTYFASPTKYKNYFILIGSIVFYIWGSPKFIFILLASCIVDYYLSLKNEKKYLFFAILLNTVLLCYFKYMNFFIENIEFIMSTELKWTKIFAPLGISFIVFSKISYLVDTYRKEVEIPRKFTDYLLFILCFPKLIAGPITKFKEFSPQLLSKKDEKNLDNIFLGLFRLVFGLSKKVLIADVLGKNANLIFASNINDLSTGLAWFGSLCYTFQIYFDFSAYSDMAIGLGKMLSFTFPENFNFPYISQSITEFWRRWHITLGAWMKDYLYIPLGGNRKGQMRTLINLFIIFLLSGIWHGANWTFLIWGIYNGIFLVLERLFLLDWLKKIGKLPSIVLSFFIVNLGWVIFKCDTLTQAVSYYKRLFSINNFVINDNTVKLLADIDFGYRFIFIFTIAALFSFVGIFKKTEIVENLIYKKQDNIYIISLQIVIMFLLLFLSTNEILTAGFNPFIYFRF